MEYADEKLRRDKELVKKAVKVDIRAIEYALINFLNEEQEFLYELLMMNYKIFKYLSKSLRSDVDLLITMV